MWIHTMVSCQICQCCQFFGKSCLGDVDFVCVIQAFRRPTATAQCRRPWREWIDVGQGYLAAIAADAEM